MSKTIPVRAYTVIYILSDDWDEPDINHFRDREDAIKYVEGEVNKFDPKFKIDRNLNDDDLRFDFDNNYFFYEIRLLEIK